MARYYDLSIIIPVFNEEENISKLVSVLHSHITHLGQIRTEVVFVDDGSTDNTYEKLRKTSGVLSSSHIIKLSRNFGSHSALRAGVYHARGRFITFLSADLQDPFEVIVKMYQKCQEGVNVVVASRNSDNITMKRKFISGIYARLVRKFVFPNFPKSNFDIVMFDRNVQKILNKHIEAHSSIFLQLFDLGFNQAVISYTKQERLHGGSKWTFAKKLKLFVDSFIAFSYAPIHFISFTGISLSIVGFVWALYVFARTLIVKDVQSGWPTLIGVLMIGFGITNISLGIIAEYIWRIFDLSRQKPTFIIDKIVTPKHEKK